MVLNTGSSIAAISEAEMKTALITNIQRFSLNDGPGIRTTVFFQGCNMHCAWCHNPETLPGHPVLMHYTGKCIGCGTCFETCPNGAHKIVNGKHVIDRGLCRNCGKCAELCFANALIMSSRPYTVDEVMNEILQDELYYQESAGGVTFSGGEAGLHAGFIEQLADCCHAEEIPVAVETNMSLPWSKIAPMLSKMDLIMCDIKHMDSPTHKKWTGADNQLILNNVGRASRLGIPIIVRTPLIPGVTDNVENLRAIGAYISGMQNIFCYELLNFNPLGGSKRTALQEENDFEDCKPFSVAALEELRQQLVSLGVTVKIS